MTDLELMGEILEKPIAFHKVFFDITKDVKAALFLSQLYYWSKKMKHDWFYKSRESWEEETGLTRYEQENIKKKLNTLKILDCRLKDMPAKQYFKFNFERLIELAKQCYSLSAEKSPTCRQQNPLHVGESAADMSAENSPTINRTETTTENTTDIKKINKKEISPQPKKEIIPIEEFLLTPELLTWGAKQPNAWTADEMQIHYEFYLDYLENIPIAKRKKNLAAQFRNAVRGNWANIRRVNQAKSWQQQNNEATDRAKENFLKMMEGNDGNAEIDYFS